MTPRRSPGSLTIAIRLPIVLLLSFAACGGGGRHDAAPPQRQATTDVTAGARVSAASESAAAENDEGTSPPSTDVELHAAAELQRIADQLARGRATARTVGGSSTYHVVAARRSESGVPEVHDGWIDVTLVQAGHAMLLAGGHVKGGEATTGGERRGGAIVGGVRRSIAAGDLFIVPAGVPHQFQLAAGDTISYLTIKVPRSPRGH